MSADSVESGSSKPQQRPISLSRRLASGILRFLVVLVIVFGVVIGVVMTPWGTKAIVSLTNSLVVELAIDYHSGSVVSGVRLSTVKWQQTDLKIDMSNLQLAIKPSCILSFALCVESVSADKTVVELSLPESTDNAQTTNAALTLPFPLSVEQFDLNKFSLKVQNKADINWHRLTGKLDFQQRLRIEKMQLDGFALVIHDSDKTVVNQVAEPFDWAKWQYQPISSLPIVLPIHFDVVAFNMSSASVKLPEQEQFAVKKLNLKATGNSKEVQLHKLFVGTAQGQLVAQGNLKLGGSLEHVLIVDAEANLDAQAPLTLTFKSSGDVNALSIQAQLIQQTTTATSLVNDTQAKPLNLAVDISAKPSQANLPVKATINWQQLSWPLEEPEIHSKSGIMDMKGDLSALNLSLQTTLSGKNLPSSQVSLSANAMSTTLSKSVELNEFLIESLGGQVLSRGKLRVSEFIEWQGNSIIKHIDPSVFWPKWQADINGEVSTQITRDKGVWKANASKLDINGQWQGYPLSMSGNVDYHERNGLQFNAIALKNADNTLTLDGGVSRNQQLDIQYHLNAQELSKTLPQIKGALNLSGSVNGKSTQPEISYDLMASDLKVSQVFVQKAKGTGNIKWNDHKPVNLALTLSGIQGNNNQIDTAQIQLTGDAQQHQLDVSTSGQSASANLSIQGQLSESSWQGSWLSGDIKSSYANLTLQQPFKIEADWANQHYLIAPHCWEHSENEVCIKLAEFKKNSLAWDVSLKEFDVLSLVHRLIPSIPKIKTQSRLNLNTSGEWDIKKLPNAKINASLSQGEWQFSEPNKLKLELHETLVNIQLTPQKILADINLSGSEIGSVKAKVQGQSGVFTDPLNRPIQGELLIEHFDLAAFKALVPQLNVLQGDINGKALIDGTLGSPLLTGDLTLAKGALKDESLPVALSAIEQSISLKGQSAEFQGTYMLGKGLGNMQGDITWTPAFKSHVHISGEELEFDYQNMIKASVSPNIDISFAPNNIEVTGEVAIPFARVKVKELPKESISPSKDVVLVERQNELSTNQQRLALNVLIKIDPMRSNNVKLDAFGLTTDLRGELKLQDNKGEIFGNGEIALVNGRYRAYGQNLMIREGDLLFTNSLDRPYLNVEAVRDPDLTADDVIAGLRVEGVAQNPNVSVFSVPAMEQQQILAYMLTGRGLGESSGDSQDTVITNALLSLGLGKSENLVSQVGNKLGFNDVSLETSGQGDDTQLSLSGTIAPGVQLRYGVGVFDSISEVAIRYELIPKLYVEAVSGVSNAIDIYYQFSIEGSQNERVKDD